MVNHFSSTAFVDVKIQRQSHFITRLSEYDIFKKVEPSFDDRAFHDVADYYFCRRSLLTNLCKVNFLDIKIYLPGSSASIMYEEGSIKEHPITISLKTTVATYRNSFCNH